MELNTILRPLALCVAVALGGCASEALRNPLPGSVMGEDQGTGRSNFVKPESDKDSAAQRRVDLYRGNGNLVKEPTQKKAETTKAGDVELNFARVDLQEVIQTIMGDLLHANFIIDPGVTGEVTLHTSRPVAKEDLIPVLDELLRTHGMIMVREQDGLYRISPQAGYKGPGLVPELSKNGKNLPEGYGVRIVPLKYISATEMQKILQPLAPESAIMRVDTVRNMLMLAGSRQQLANMMATIDTFDVDWLAGMSVGFFELKYSNVEEVSTALQKVFGADGEGPMAGLVRVVPLERLRGILLISPRAGILDDARKWIERLDRQDRGEGLQIFVYHVQNTKAAQLAELLGQLYGSQQGGATGSTAPKQAGVAPGLSAAKSSTSGLSGGSTLGGASSGLGGGMTGGGMTGGSTAGGLSQSRSPFSPTSGGGSKTGTASTGMAGSHANQQTSSVAITTEITQGREPVRIVSNDENNSLVILATPEEYHKVEAALKRLDVQPMQVLVEATIVELTLTDELRYGLQWFFDHNVGGYTGVGALVSDSAVALNTGLKPSTLKSFSYGLIDSSSKIRALLSAQAGQSNVRVLSSPSLLVLDNHTAEIRVGNQVPIQTGSITSGTTSTTGLVSANTFQYKDTGVILGVTPRVNAGGLITMEISQEISAKGNRDEATQQTMFSQRSVKSTVAVQSGESIVLGGLISGSNSNSDGGLPGLKDIPGVGVLFGSTSRTEERTELIILLTPRAVRSQMEAIEASNELRQKMQGISRAYRESRDVRDSGAKQPSVEVRPLPTDAKSAP